VLQTIGLSIIVRRRRRPAALRWGKPLLLGVALLAYLIFLVAYEPAQDVAAQPSAHRLTLFLDYPPWPWICLVLVGASCSAGGGATSPRAGADAPSSGILAIVGIGLMQVASSPSSCGPRRRTSAHARRVLNHHWVPAPITSVWILAPCS